jgi:hypothetical protein
VVVVVVVVVVVELCLVVVVVVELCLVVVVEFLMEKKSKKKTSEIFFFPCSFHFLDCSLRQRSVPHTLKHGSIAPREIRRGIFVPSVLVELLGQMKISSSNVIANSLQHSITGSQERVGEASGSCSQRIQLWQNLLGQQKKINYKRFCLQQNTISPWTTT